MLRVQTQGSRIASPPWNCGFCKTEALPAPQCLTKRGLARTGDRGSGRRWAYSGPWYRGTEHDRTRRSANSSPWGMAGPARLTKQESGRSVGVSFISSGSQSHSPKEQRFNGTPVRTRARLERVSSGQWLESPGGRGPRSVSQRRRAPGYRERGADARPQDRRGFLRSIGFEKRT